MKNMEGFIPDSVLEKLSQKDRIVMCADQNATWMNGLFLNIQ